MAAGRPREFDRTTALEAAMALFWRKGYSGTSLSELCEVMGIRSPSLYGAFRSKDALYQEALGHYVASIASRIWEALEGAPTARDGVRNMLLLAAESLPASRVTPGGCMVMLGAVSDEWPATVAADVRKLRIESLRKLRTRLKAAVSSGELSPATEIDSLARFCLAAFQGMAVQARDGATRAELKGVVEFVMSAWPRGGS